MSEKTKYKLKRSVVGRQWVWRAYTKEKFLWFEWWEAVPGTMRFDKKDCEQVLVEMKLHWIDFNSQIEEEEFVEI